MRYTEKGREKETRRKHNFIYSFQLMLTIVIGLIVTTSLFGLFFKATQLNKTTEPKENKETNYNVSESKINKEQPSNNNADSSIVNFSKKVIFEPIHQYTNEYTIKELRENTINNINRIKQQQSSKPNKMIEISSNKRQDYRNWEECPPYKRQGYDYSNAVILCKDDNIVILPIR